MNSVALVDGGCPSSIDLTSIRTIAARRGYS